MSGYPVLIEGRALTALVVGGGRVALRKARTLLAAGAIVRVVAPTISPDLERLRKSERRLTVERRGFQPDDIRNATLVIAATDDRTTNARVAQLAQEQHRLISVADLPSEGNFVGMATHQSGDLVIGVSAGGVPRAALRIRDAIAERFDSRYAEAVDALRRLRRRLLDAGDATHWRLAMRHLIDDSFCARVESGTLAGETDTWR